MRSPKNPVVASLVVALLPAGSSALGQQGSWKNKPIDSWTQDEAYQVLKSSPWVKSLRPDVLHAQSESERRDGGNMGRPTGLGFDGIGDSESEFWRRRVGEVPTLVLRWETAKPVRGARKKYHSIEPPTLNADVYSLAVYGLPGGDYKGNPVKLAKPLRQQAVLRRAGKKDVKPSRVVVFLQRDESPIIVYEFPRTLEITKDDKSLYFLAVIGRLSVVEAFDTESMQFEGQLEL
jgi:hypothetical protein